MPGSVDLAALLSRIFVLLQLLLLMANWMSNCPVDAEVTGGLVRFLPGGAVVARQIEAENDSGFGVLGGLFFKPIWSRRRCSWMPGHLMAAFRLSAGEREWWLGFLFLSRLRSRFLLDSSSIEVEVPLGLGRTFSFDFVRIRTPQLICYAEVNCLGSSISHPNSRQEIGGF
ncbi:unnamed protein product [Linum trigynum]|uniref:Secreted protein n=1 Tax=Linum trigynum TaxID=586398 RepID=A0AAV2GX22_9ROSI